MRYVETQLRAGSAPSTIYTHHLPTINARHLAVTFHSPTQHPVVSMLVQHLKAAHKLRPSKKKLPADYKMLAHAWAGRTSSLLGLLKATSAVVAFTVMLRSKEYCAKSGSSWDPDYQSKRSDISFFSSDDPDHLFPTSNVQDFKADGQHGFVFKVQGQWSPATHFLSHATITIHGDKVGGVVDWKRSISPSANPICALSALLAFMTATAPMPDGSPLFSLPSGYVLSYADMLSDVKGYASAVGYDPAKYGTHSLRSGGCSALLAAGVSPDIIRILGRWRSDAFFEYAVPSVYLFRGLAAAVTRPINLRFLSRV